MIREGTRTDSVATKPRIEPPTPDEWRRAILATVVEREGVLDELDA